MWGIRMSHCILCQNEYQFNIIRKKFPGKTVIKITNPVLLDKNAANLSMKNRNYIAWIGIFQYQKNIKLLYTIAHLLKREKFLVAGKEIRNCDEETLNYLEKLKQLPNVEFIGFLKRDQVLSFLSEAKYLLNTSHYEGFSNTFLEAMLVGTPILTSQLVNPDSIISNHDLGVVYNDAEDLMNKYCAVNPEQYSQMSENVKKYVVHQHDYKVLSRRLVELLAVYD
ncbi:MAG: glycosyltransferase family 4 protein [Flavisolibacter sp.]